MSDSECPSVEQLQELVAGALHADDENLLTAHVGSCQRCIDTLDGLSGDVEELDSLPQAFADAPELPAELEVVLTDLSDSGSSVLSDSGSANHSDILPWIEASRKDGLGRLDEYELIEVIGRGGMGIVFKAEDGSLGRTVALKMLAPAFAFDDEAKQRFIREARAVASIKHPNVITIHAVAEGQPLPYLVMEYVEGESLRQRLKESKALPVDEIVRIGSQIAAGLHACHREGIIHRDIKPSNVLLEMPDAQVKISDFGLAHVESSSQLTQTGHLVGTPGYIAPERLTGNQEIDGRSDLFSLGCLLYLMSTGEEAFAGDSAMSTLHRITQIDPTPLSKLNPALPGWFNQLAESLLKKNPADRPASAAAVRDALQTRSAPPRGTAVNQKRELLKIVSVLALIAAAIVFLSSRATNRTQAIIVETSAELEQALLAAEDGDVISLRTNDILVTSDLTVEDISLTLAAAPGYSPTLQLDASDDDEPVPLLSLLHADVRLVGISFIDPAEPEDESPEDEREEDELDVVEAATLVSVEGGRLVAERCRFVSRGWTTCLDLLETEQVELYSCQLHTPLSTGVVWTCNEDAPEDRQSLVFDNCLQTGNSAVVVFPAGDCTLNWTQCTAVVDWAALEIMPPEDSAENRLAVNVKQTVLQSLEWLVVTELPEATPESLQKYIAWHSANNVLNGPLLLVNEDEEQPDWANDLNAWATGVSDTVRDQQVFALEHDDLMERLYDSSHEAPRLLEVTDAGRKALSMPLPGANVDEPAE